MSGPGPASADADRLAAHGRAVELYGQTWWHDDPGVAAIEQRQSGLRDRLATVAAVRGVTTAAVYLDAAGAYAPQRVALHDELVRQSLPPPGTAVRTPPTVVYTTGGMGTGKSTTLRAIAWGWRRLRLGAGREGVVVAEADAIREALHEYRGGLGSAVVQDEAFEVTYERLIPEAIDRRCDLVYDTIGVHDSIRPTLDRLLAAGYEVHMIVATAPLDVCAARVRDRALSRDGRLVDPVAQASVAAAPQATLERLLAENVPLTGWAVIDTAQPDGLPRRLKSGGAWADIDNDTLREMLDTG